MKRYIRSARDYNSSRAVAYQNKQAARQAAKQLESQRREYVQSIRDELEAYLESEIDRNIFEPVLTQDVRDRYLAYHKDTYSKYYDADKYATMDHLRHGVDLYIHAAPEYIEIDVGVFGVGYENNGLEWIADLETGGDGAICNNYISKIPARMKHKFEEYKDTIADLIEAYGFDILEAPRNDSNGFVYKVTNDEYDALTAQ